MAWIGILDIFKGLLTPIIAGVVAYIAYQQHKTNRDKLMLDMYDRRLGVFGVLIVLLRDIVQNRTCSDQERHQFQSVAGEAIFLFDKDIENYLETIYKKTVELEAIHAELGNLPCGDKRNEEAKKEGQLLDWFMDQFEVSKEKFARYLRFRQTANPSASRTMNWERGLKRIVLCFAIVAGGFGGVLSIIGVYGNYDYAHYKLERKQEDIGKGDMLDRVATEREVKKLQDTFWVDLSTGELVALCIFAGLGGAAAGYAGTWAILWYGSLAIFIFIGWLILGFRDEPDKSKASENNK